MINNLFTAAGCSPENDILDVGKDGVLVYGSGKNVILTDIAGEETRLLPDGPHDQVHSVKLLSQASGQSMAIVAVAADGCIRVWSAQGALVASLRLSETALVSLAVSSTSSTGPFEIITADSVDNLYFVSFSHSQLVLENKLALTPRKIVCLAAAWYQESLLVLAGLSDSSIVVIVEGEVKLRLGGHLNWVNSLDCFAQSADDSILIASGSSDKTVRVWKVSRVEGAKVAGLVELLPMKNTFTLAKRNSTLRAVCDAIIYGHEGMVNSVRWIPSNSKELPELISASTDRTVFIWKGRLDEPTGTTITWDSQLQLGDISGVSTAAGYHFATVLSNGKAHERLLLAYGATGSIVRYTICGSEAHAMPPLVTGHTLEVKSCDWEPTGKYLITCSLDQTTRIWTSAPQGKWREIARPQIHGYDMLSVRSLDEQSFISAGDEKILRSFEAPTSFPSRLNGVPENANVSLTSAGGTGVVVVPALGLSNKAKEADASGPSPQLELPLAGPPSERDLARMTLWMETDKLYGHGLELYTVAVSNCKRFAASASRATTPEDAIIRLWERLEGGVWRPLAQTIACHTLTVVKLDFSPDDKHLLSVSRDRHWALTALNLKEGKVELVKYFDAHGRIIWGCAWSNDGSFFVTGSRDRTVKTWQRELDWSEAKQFRLTLPTAVTALALHQDQNLLAAGLEDGNIVIYSLVRVSGWDEVCRITNAHASAVNEVKWGPHEAYLASVSDLLQIHQVLQTARPAPHPPLRASWQSMQ